jgi:hypothetical protein
MAAYRGLGFLKSRIRSLPRLESMAMEYVMPSGLQMCHIRICI